MSASQINITEEQINKYYNDIQNDSYNENVILYDVDQKNNIIFQKERIQLQLLNEIENKEKLLLTRSKMLQISQDRNAYKKMLIYTSIAFGIILFIIILFVFHLVRKPRFKTIQVPI
jgi:phosphoribosylaminoimidazole carboxylase (NCAIR synthetase)